MEITDNTDKIEVDVGVTMVNASRRESGRITVHFKGLSQEINEQFEVGTDVWHIFHPQSRVLHSFRLDQQSIHRLGISLRNP